MTGALYNSVLSVPIAGTGFIALILGRHGFGWEKGKTYKACAFGGGMEGGAVTDAQEALPELNSHNGNRENLHKHPSARSQHGASTACC